MIKIGCLELKRIGVFSQADALANPNAPIKTLYYIYCLQWVGKKIFRITKDWRFR